MKALTSEVISESSELVAMVQSVEIVQSRTVKDNNLVSVLSLLNEICLACDGFGNNFLR